MTTRTNRQMVSAIQNLCNLCDSLRGVEDSADEIELNLSNMADELKVAVKPVFKQRAMKNSQRVDGGELMALVNDLGQQLRETANAAFLLQDFCELHASSCEDEADELDDLLSQ